MLTYKNIPVVLEWGIYENGTIGLDLLSEEGEPVTRVTTNVGFLPDTAISVKNYSENAGIEKWLIENNIIEDEPIHHIPSGFVEIPVYLLTDAAEEEMEEALF